jgi:hypothetical protein
VTNTPVDGFSWPFQSMAVISGLVYAASGMAILWKLLEKYFDQKTILVVMFGIVYGTNLFHYATYDSIFSHTYSFFLFSAFLYYVQRIYCESSVRYFLIGGAVGGFIIITRPTNGLWILFGIFYGVDSLRSMIERLRFWKNNTMKVFYAAIPFVGIIFLQLIYWKITTGSFLINLYRNEHFNFARPEILNVLFSARKGLFFWSPILLTVIPGMFYVIKKAREFFLPILLFLPLNIYVISSWSSWFYGGSFGHRGFTESIPLFAICFASFYDGLYCYFWKRSLVYITLLCITLSTWLMIKYWTGVIPYDGTTLDHFVRTFFILRKG